MMIKVKALKGLLQSEQESLERLTKGKEEESAALIANKKLVEQLSSLQKGGNQKKAMEALRGSLDAHEKLAQERAELVKRLEAATEAYERDLEREEESTGKLESLLSMAGRLVALKEGKEKLEAALSDKPTTRKLDAAIRAQIELIEGLLPPPPK